MKSTKECLKEYESYLKLKNYASSTQEAYLNSLRFFLQFREDQNIRGGLNQEQAKEFLLFRYDRGCSWSLINIHYSGIKNYFTGVLDIPWDFKKLPRPRKDHKLPELLSTKEVGLIISRATLYKHQVMISLLYATGLRISEMCNLEMKDISGDRLEVHIRLGKGGKDRLVHMPKSMLTLLREYYQRCRPVKYLFNGQGKGTPISSSAVNAAIANGRHRAKVMKSVSAHTFRHCFATHHLEAGTNLVYLQKELGHKNLKTTAKYIRLAKEYHLKVTHPIDAIQIDYYKQNRPSVNYLETLARPTSASIPPVLTR